MIKISKKSQYGLRAMVCLAKHYKPKSRLRSNRGSPDFIEDPRRCRDSTKSGKVCSTKTISEIEGIPFDFLEKIISRLERAKLVKGKKGVLGGYILSRSPKKISVNDVVSVLEENKKTVNCALCARLKKCSAKNVWSKLDDSLNKTLKSITLENLIR